MDFLKKHWLLLTIAVVVILVVVYKDEIKMKMHGTADAAKADAAKKAIAAAAPDSTLA